MWRPPDPLDAVVGLGDHLGQARTSEAVALHIESLRAQGEPVPPPSTVATTVIAPPTA